MSKEANIETQKKFGEAVNTGKLEALRDLVAPSSIDHDPAQGQENGPEGYIKFFAMMRTAFPDLKVNLVKLVADDDSIAFAYELTGTHTGPFQGIAPTNKPIKARGVQISTFKDGKMVERWGSSDELGILSQLGLHVGP